MAAAITGLGVYLPEKILTNAQISKFVDTTDEWITTRTGIKERRLISDQEQVSDIGVKAAKVAIEQANINPQTIDLIVFASASPEMIWPATACLIQAKLGLKDVPAFDLQAACTGFSYALTVIDALITAKFYKRVLLVCAEAMSRFINWQDRSTCILFGDGAAALILEPAKPGYGFLAHWLAADGNSADLLKIAVGGSAKTCSAQVRAEETQTITMNGSEVFRFAVKALPESIVKVLEQAKLTIDDVAFFLPHQANKRIIEAASQRLKLPATKVVCNIAKYGNSSTASIPIALWELLKETKVKDKDILLFAGFGAGLTYGANLLRWQESGGD